MDSNLGSLLKSSGKSSEIPSGILSDLNNPNLSSRDSCENGSVGNAANFSVDSRNKPNKWGKSALPSFDLGV